MATGQAKQHGMKILGIETSCDETAVCLIEAEGDLGADFRFRILGNALNSQASAHAAYGGVFPNLARGEHEKNLVPLLGSVLEMSRCHLDIEGAGEKQNMSRCHLDMRKILEREPELYNQLVKFLKESARPDIDTIAVTVGPGLEPALWTGINLARALASAWKVPIVAVNHMEGHILIALASDDESDREKGKGNSLHFTKTYSLRPITFPLLSLLISGGHTELILSKEFGQYDVIGETRDDAVGEAFDKVARLLGLPYPGGPHISRLAESARKSYEVSPHRILPRPMLHDPSFDFSFSGLKTAVRRLVEGRALSESDRAAIAREFEDAATDVLFDKTRRAVEEFGVKTLVVGGGVSANANIRKRLGALTRSGCAVFFPAPEYATDNAVMIALAGYFHAMKKEFADPANMKADGNLRL